MIDASQLPAIAVLEPKNRYPALLSSELAFGIRVVLCKIYSVGR
jgi:hypothetical protein